MLMSSAKARFLSLLLLAFSKSLVIAITPELRGEAECGFMTSSATIYCYGGQMTELKAGYGEDAPTAILGDVFITLNLTQNTNVAALQNSWERVSSDAGSNIYPAFAVVPQHDIIFMDGGRGAGNNGQTLARYKTTIFNADVRSWSTDTPSRDGVMVQTHTATLGQDNNTLYVWGGFRDQDTGLPDGIPVEYPLEMYLFDIKNSKWSSKSPVATLDATRAYQKAVCIGSSIYYIGGIMPLSVSQFVEAPMNSVVIYDTDIGQWRTQHTNGPEPTTRIRHSATLLPTGDILIFGGQHPLNNTIYRPDYLYTLQITDQQLTWSNSSLKIDTDPGSSGFNGLGMIGHSAVLVGNNLFFMFGRILDVNLNVVQNTLLILDVNKWSWISSVSAVSPETQPADESSSDETVGNRNDSSSNTGAIAGGVVGGVVGVAVIAGAIFFLLRRKRNQQKSEKSGYVLNNNMTSPQEDVPPPQYYNSDPNNNVHQPMLPVSNIPYPADGMASSDRSYPRTPVSTNNTPPSWQDRSTYHNSEKPDASISPSGSSGNQEPIRLVMQPVKPDGA